jgi:hypothetical protein
LRIVASRVKLTSLEHGANGGGRIACFELFEEIVALQIFLLWDLRVTSKMRSMLEEVVVGSLGYRNRSGSLTYVDGMGRVC